MKTTDHNEARFVENLGRFVAQAEPAPLGDRARAEVIQRALTERTRRIEEPKNRSVRVWLAAAVILMAAGAGGFWLRGTLFGVRSNDVVPITMRLPTGDTLTSTAGTEFELVDASATARQIRVRRGIMLFDVRPLQTGEQFQVRTKEITVNVVGTVFSVEAIENETRVHVFEGQVEIENKTGAPSVLFADQSWSSRGGRLDLGHNVALYEAGAGAAKKRSTAYPPVADTSSAQFTAAATEPTPSPALPEPPPPEPAAPASENDKPFLNLSAARSLLLSADYAEALEQARRARETSPSADWILVEADALRGLRRFAEAADRFDAAAFRLSRSAKERAGFTAATLRFSELHDPAGAIRSLDASRASASGSALEERALALRVRCLVELGRSGEAKSIARAYLDKFPSTAMNAWMQSVLAQE